MVAYRWFFCGTDISEEQLRKRIRCPYCGSKIIYKPRQVAKKIKAI